MDFNIGGGHKTKTDCGWVGQVDDKYKKRKYTKIKKQSAVLNTLRDKTGTQTEKDSPQNVFSYPMIEPRIIKKSDKITSIVPRSKEQILPKIRYALKIYRVHYTWD